MHSVWNIQSVSIKMRVGKRANLKKLEKLGYKWNNKSEAWEFIGIMHLYSFEIWDEDLIISITPNDRYNGLVPEITFGQINDWVFNSLVTIGYPAKYKNPIPYQVSGIKMGGIRNDNK